MNTTDFVINRLIFMALTPRMWAGNKESFVQQIVVMLEMLEIFDAEQVQQFIQKIFRRPGTNIAFGINDEVDDEWAARVVKEAQTILQEFTEDDVLLLPSARE